MTLLRSFILILVITGLHAADYGAPAKFRVTPDIVNENVGPFTATIGAIGNEVIGTPYEPKLYRTMMWVAEDAPDTVMGELKTITAYDSFKEGMFEGADVRIYRVVNGKIVLVREDKVAPGGHRLSGWYPASGRLVAPDTTEFAYHFAGFNRKDVPYYFTVAAVDKNGNESPLAEGNGQVWPKGLKSKKVKNKTVNFKEPRRPKEKDAPPAPTNVKVRLDKDRGVMIITWSKVDAPDLAGYRIYKSDYDPSRHRGYGYDLAGRARTEDEKIKAGDLAFISKKFYTQSRKQFCSNRVYGAGSANKTFMQPYLDFFPDEDPAKSWELVQHSDTSPIPDGGETALKLTLKTKEKMELKRYAYGPVNQSWWLVLKPDKEYVAEVWLKQDGMADPSVTFFLNGFYQGKINAEPFAVNGEWKKYQARFKPGELYKKGGIGQMGLRFNGPGTIWIDNFRVYQADEPYLGWSPEEKAALLKSGMASLRTHGFIKTGTTTYDMQQLTNPAGILNGAKHGNTLPQTLSAIREANMVPWLQVEFHMTPKEWLGFVEYMAAPYDPAKDTPQSKPWAYKRYKQGQKKPWLNEWDKIYFELSNETWNWLFKPWVFEGMTDAATGKKYGRGEVYGMFQQHVYEMMKTSPYWKSQNLEDRLVWVLGGWSRSTYGHDAATMSPKSEYATIAAYNGGWDEGEGPAERGSKSLFSILSQVTHSGHHVTMLNRNRRDALRKEGKADYRLGTYEAGPGYALSGLNGQGRMSKDQVRAQEEAMKSLAAGTATLDTFLDKAYYDFDIQNFFTFHVGKTHWVSHTEWHKGAHAYPAWKTLCLFNKQGAGDFLYVDRVSSPTIDLPKKKRRPAQKDAPLAACYATRNGDRVNLFILSRKIDDFPQKGDDGFTPCSISLPFSNARSITLYRMVGDPRTHNLDEDLVKIEKVDIPASQFAQEFVLNKARGADDRGLPPAATLLYVFEGVAMAKGKPVEPQGLGEQQDQ